MNLTEMYLGERLLTPRQFAQRINTSIASVKMMVMRRQIHYFKVGPDCVDAMGRDRRRGWPSSWPACRDGCYCPACAGSHVEPVHTYRNTADAPLLSANCPAY